MKKRNNTRTTPWRWTGHFCLTHNLSSSQKYAYQNSHSLFFTSTGKERDEETGYSYYGARYYDPEISGLFLSVDPMANKYPGISPYVYCAWNPIVLTDPNGDTIKNGYENYKDVAEDIQYYQNMASLTNDPEVIKEYNQQIDFLKKKHKNYQTVNDLILSFEKTIQTNSIYLIPCRSMGSQ